jgi:pimeloyl-ACP methyl ester carboxylesterase
MVAEGKGGETLPRNAFFNTPVSAHRFIAFADRLGQDDYFSSDLTDEELTGRLGHLATIPTLFVYSGADEYVPAHVDKERLVARFCAAAGEKARSVIVPGADHAITEGPLEVFLQSVVGFCLEVFKSKKA